MAIIAMEGIYLTALIVCVGNSTYYGSVACIPDWISVVTSKCVCVTLPHKTFMALLQLATLACCPRYFPRVHQRHVICSESLQEVECWDMYTSVIGALLRR